MTKKSNGKRHSWETRIRILAFIGLIPTIVFLSDKPLPKTSIILLSSVAYLAAMFMIVYGWIGSSNDSNNNID